MNAPAHNFSVFDRPALQRRTDHDLSRNFTNSPQEVTLSASVVSSPWQVTVANGASFDTDLGVFYAATGIALTKVATGPTVGQYSVSAAGVYTFATTDAGKAVLISYAYTGTGVAPRQVTTLGNPLIGVQPTFQLVFNTQYNGAMTTFKMLACVSNKFSLQTKLEDWTIPEIDFDCFCDASNHLLTYSTPE